MKKLPWILVAVGLTALALWIVVGPWYPRNPLVILLVTAFFGMPALGGFWMLYIAVRHEKNPLPLLLLAFLPWAFLWYYFERVRPRQHLTRESHT